MAALSQQRCLHHAAREAVARCPECGRFFCRECITEHDNRVICASCLKLLVQAPAKKRTRLAAVARTAQFALGIFVAWLFFFCLGQLLLKTPSSFHDGTLWRSEEK